MHAVDMAHGKLFKQAFLNHDPATAFALFRWLEDEIDCSIEIAGLR